MAAEIENKIRENAGLIAGEMITPPNEDQVKVETEGLGEDSELQATD